MNRFKKGRLVCIADRWHYHFDEIGKIVGRNVHGGLDVELFCGEVLPFDEEQLKKLTLLGYIWTMIVWPTR